MMTKGRSLLHGVVLWLPVQVVAGVVNWFPDDKSRLVYSIDLKFLTLLHNDTRKKPIVWGGPPVPGSGDRRGGQPFSG